MRRRCCSPTTMTCSSPNVDWGLRLFSVSWSDRENGPSWTHNPKVIGSNLAPATNDVGCNPHPVPNSTPTISPTHHEQIRNRHATPENMIPRVFRGFLNVPDRSNELRLLAPNADPMRSPHLAYFGDKEPIFWREYSGRAAEGRLWNAKIHSGVRQPHERVARGLGRVSQDRHEIRSGSCAWPCGSLEEFVPL